MNLATLLEAKCEYILSVESEQNEMQKVYFPCILSEKKLCTTRKKKQHKQISGMVSRKE